MISVCFQGKPFSITVIQVYAPTSNAEEAEVEPFYEDLQVLLELTPKKDVLFIIGDWNAKVGSQETPGVTGKFCLGIWNEAGQRLIEFCQENDQPRQHIQKQRHYFANKDPSSHACTHAVTSVMSNSVRPYGQQPTRHHCPRDSLGKKTGVGCQFLLHNGILVSKSEKSLSCA